MGRGLITGLFCFLFSVIASLKDEAIQHINNLISGLLRAKPSQ